MATKKASEATVKRVREKKPTAKEKARRYLDRKAVERVHPVTYEAILLAYAALGIVKYDAVLAEADSYRNDYMDALNNIEGKEEK